MTVVMDWPRFLISLVVATVNMVMLLRLYTYDRMYRQNGINGEVTLVLRAAQRRAWARLGLALATLVTAVIAHGTSDPIDRWIIFYGMALTLWLSGTSLADMRRADALAGEQLRKKYARAPSDEQGC